MAYNKKEERRRGAGSNVLVLTDMRMEHMDGLHLAEELLNVKPDTKIVLMSANKLDAKMMRHLRLVSTEDPPQKPFETKRLCTVIENATRTPQGEVHHYNTCLF